MKTIKTHLTGSNAQVVAATVKFGETLYAALQNPETNKRAFLSGFYTAAAVFLNNPAPCDNDALKLFADLGFAYGHDGHINLMTGIFDDGSEVDMRPKTMAEHESRNFEGFSAPGER